MNKIKGRILDQIGLDQIKHIGLEQEDQTNQIRVDESKKIEEENSSLRKCGKSRFQKSQEPAKPSTFITDCT